MANGRIGTTLLLGALALAAAPIVAKSPTPSSTRVSIPAHDLMPAEAAAHVWNRLGYGPRPGDTAALPGDAAIAAWIERQLAPESIADEATEERLSALPLAAASPIELFVQYPPPALVTATGRAADRAGIPEAELLAALPELAEVRARRSPGAGSPGGKPETGERPQRDPLGNRRRIGVELQLAKIVRATSSERQLHEVMTDFWFNHFNVFVGKQTTLYQVGDYERNAIRPHALGRFRDLLGAVASHPAMLIYLDNARSIDPGAGMGAAEIRARARRETLVPKDRSLPPGGLVTLLLRERGIDTTQIERGAVRAASRPAAPARMAMRETPEATLGLNENYARELLELHTLGVDGGYTQKDVEEVARCFTGWTLRPLTAGQTFVFDKSLHDRSKRTVLGEPVPAGGRDQGETVLDRLARHPSTARFVSTKLARRFVADDPPEALVARMAETFLATDGGIREVLRTLVSSPEFWSRDALGAKVRTPFEVAAASLRALDGSILPLPEPGAKRPSPNRPAMLFVLRELGNAPYAAQPPTGYGDTAEDWVSAGALLQRMKLAVRIASGRLPGVRVAEPALAAEDEAGIAALAERVLGRAASGGTIETVRQQLEGAEDMLAELGLPARIARSPEGRARLAIGWILASADFQRR